jgi:adenylate cyclase
VFRVDDEHVAISNQFFTKTIANLSVNPLATLVLVDPDGLTSYKFLIRHERSEEAGPLFDTMRRSIDSIAALTGMSDVFSLRAAVMFRVLDVSVAPSGGPDAG